MRTLIQLLLVSLFMYAGDGFGASIAKPPVTGGGGTASKLSPAAVQYALRLNPAAFQKATGIKLHLADRLALRLYQWKLRRQSGNGYITERQRKLGLLSLIFGAGAFVVAILPIIGLLSVPSAIAGIVLGIISLKGNTNINGILGICFGSVFLLLLAAVIALIAVFFSLW